MNQPVPFAVTYAVTAASADGKQWWCDLIDGFLVLFPAVTYLDHGPHIRNVCAAARKDPHLFGVRVETLNPLEKP